MRIRIGFCHRALGQRYKEIKAFQQSYERGREIEESEKMGWSLYNLAETEMSLGDQEKALNHWREANSHFRQVGTLLGIIWTSVNLSLMSFLTGNFNEARSLVEEAQEMAREANRSHAIQKESHIVLGYLALIEQDYQKAQYFFEEVLSATTISPEASLGLTFLACGLEVFPTAGRRLLEALQPSSPYRIPAMAVLCLPAAALILWNEGKEERPIELLALAFDHSESPKDLLEKWPLVRRLRTEMRESVAPEVFEAAWARGKASDLTEALAGLVAHFQIEAEAQLHQALDQRQLIRPAPGGQSLVEPLSEREMEVLRLLKTELSGPEIAGELTISLNTLRFHTKNIYSKLQVNNRRSAVQRALELGLS